MEAWLAAARFQGREESQRVGDAKTREDAVTDTTLTSMHSDFLGGEGPPEPGQDARLRSWNRRGHPFYEALEKTSVIRVFSLKTEHSQGIILASL